jgi:hypothetical protein
LQESPDDQVKLLALGIGKHRPPADAVFFDVAQAYGPKSKQPVRLRSDPAGDEVGVQPVLDRLAVRYLMEHQLWSGLRHIVGLYGGELLLARWAVVA